jgi:hypothetical protein
MSINERRLFLALGLWAMAFPAFPDAAEDLLMAKRLEPFKPSWSFSVGLSASGQPSDEQGGGQSTDLSFSALHELTESGDYLSFGAVSGRTKVGDSYSAYGSLTVAGGLGLGSFCPSLSLQSHRGESSLVNIAAGLDLGFQLFDDLSAALSFYGGFYSVETRLGLSRWAVDTKTWGTGGSISWIPWEFLVVTVSSQQNQDTTFRGRNLTVPFEITGERIVRTPSASLALDFMVWNDFSISGSVTRGQVFSPPGFVWRPDLGQLVQLPAEEVDYFWGYTIGVGYSFQ